MRWAYAAIFALVVAVFLPYSAAAAQPSSQGTSRLSSIVEIEHYLTSMRVDFGGATVQTGSRNYAGPNCPGSGWTCTTATVVIQLGATNVADAAGCGTDNPCTITQGAMGGKNEARCSMDSGDVSPTQTCTIIQTNTTFDNQAEVRVTIRQKGGASQTGMQMATVTQMNESGDNRSRVDETIDQDSKDDGAQSQEADQTAVVNQTTVSGRNFSDVHQSQKQGLDAKESAVMQQQNTSCSSGRNASATVTQTSTTGANESQLRQTIDQDEKAEKAMSGNQSQGCSGGGLEADVTQDSSSVSRSVNHQSEKQTQKAKKNSAVFQDQVGPVFCCTNQTGNAANSFEINQSSDQKSNGPSYFQDTTLDGQYFTSGDGMIRQKATNNTETQSNQASGTGGRHISLSCDSGVEAGGCTTEVPD